MTLHEIVRGARATLEAAGIDGTIAALDAELLARHVLGWDRARWLTDREGVAPPAFITEYSSAIERRRQREPVAYIRGKQEFWGREFIVRRGVLIPRPETELLVEAALALLSARPQATVVDVGTGSGCIALTLALEQPAADIVATDVSPEALSVAGENARHHGVPTVRWALGPGVADTGGAIDLIVSNPPYVAQADRAALPPEVMYEPETALFAGVDGMDAIRQLVGLAATRLRSNGWLVIEIGQGQLPLVEAAARATAALECESVHEDLQGIPRVVLLRRAFA